MADQLEYYNNIGLINQPMYRTSVAQLTLNKMMKQKELSELTDQELLDEAKKMKSTSITNAVLIGFMIGIIIYSVVKSSLGFFTLIPLYFIYKIINGSKNHDALKALLKERGLMK
jgi:uncharacterized membrane protein YbjE (DUF340 family)